MSFMTLSLMGTPGGGWGMDCVPQCSKCVIRSNSMGGWEAGRPAPVGKSITMQSVKGNIILQFGKF